MESKICSKCVTTKLFSEFGKKKRGRNGIDSICKSCCNTAAKISRGKLAGTDVLSTRRKASYEKNKLLNRASDPIYSLENMRSLKTCTSCKLNLEKSRFNKGSSRSDGFLSVCKMCTSANRRSYYKKNTDKCKGYVFNNYIKNKDKISARNRNYNVANKDYLKAKAILWRSSNRHILSESWLRRTLATQKAIPSWADFRRTNLVYKEAQILTMKTGVKHSVDHIIPLRGKTVCGLHVHTNLRVIPLLENISKGNRNWEDLL